MSATDAQIAERQRGVDRRTLHRRRPTVTPCALCTKRPGTIARPWWPGPYCQPCHDHEGRPFDPGDTTPKAPRPMGDALAARVRSRNQPVDETVDRDARGLLAAAAVFLDQGRTDGAVRMLRAAADALEAP